MAKNLLVEIGTEDLPPSYIEPALQELKENTESILSRNRIDFGEVRTLGSPRRLVVYASGVPERQRDKVEKVQGPRRDLAFTPEDKPTPAAIGFARKQGVEVKDLVVENTPGGQYVFVVRREPGRTTISVLKEILPQIITSLHFPKYMRWERGNLQFARPIRWILALYGKRIVGFSLGKIRAGRVTCGHRFLSPKPLEVESADLLTYIRILKKAYVLLDHRERYEKIEREVKSIMKKYGNGGFPLQLLSKVSNSIEYPLTIEGEFPSRFLELPEEVLAKAMIEHQQYFPVRGKDGHLTNKFVVVAYGDKKYTEIIREGHQRVLIARLRDAEFFLSEDKKIRLEERVEDLKGIVYQERLGSYYDKTQRLVKMAGFLSRLLNLGDEEGEYLRRAALLCKADLLTQMVQEFPGLQGVMGGKYALRDGEAREVAQAIGEHYLPQVSGGEGSSLPRTLLGKALSLLDRVDMLAGYFGLGLIPTGSEDPYGLRRQAQGIVHVLIGRERGAVEVEKGFHLSLQALLEENIKLLGPQLKREPNRVKEDVISFLKQRAKVAFMEEGISYDSCDAILATGFDDPLDLYLRAQALEKFRNREGFEELAILFKRVINILRQARSKFSRDSFGSPREDLFREEAEVKLYKNFLKLKDTISKLIPAKEYTRTFEVVSGLKGAVDRYFDDVLVMEKDARMRDNHLALLERVEEVLLSMADFSRIVVKEERRKANGGKEGSSG